MGGGYLTCEGGGVINGGDGIDVNVESTSTFVHPTVATRHLQPIQKCHSSLDYSDQSTSTLHHA